MTGIRSGRRSSLIAVAVLALVAGVAGATLAGQATTAKKKQKGLNSKQKKQVKALAKKKANRQINKKAPGLNVNSSGSAMFADRATKADDADRVGGRTASELGTSSTYAERKSDALLTSEFQPVLDTSLETTARRIVATASIYMFGGNASAQATCQLAIDSQLGYAFDQDIPLSGPDSDATLSFTFAAAVDAGTHTIDLACKEKQGNVEVVYANITAVAVGE